MFQTGVPSPSPSKPDPLFALADENSYRISESPCAPPSWIASRPHGVTAKMAVPPRMNSGCNRSGMRASFISRASTFLVRYSGVRPTMRPAMKTATTM